MAVNPLSRSLSTSMATPKAKPKLTPLQAWQELLKQRMLAMQKPGLQLGAAKPPAPTAANPRLIKTVGAPDDAQNNPNPVDDPYYGVDDPGVTNPALDTKPQPGNWQTAGNAVAGAGGTAALAEAAHQILSGPKPGAASVPTPSPSSLSMPLVPKAPVVAIPPGTPNVITGAAPEFQLGGEGAGFAATPGSTGADLGYNAGVLGLSQAPGTTLLGSSTAGAALPAAGVAAGAYTGYQQGKGAANLAQGKNPSLIEHAALFPITGGLENLASPFMHKTEAGKQARNDNLGTFISSTGNLVNPEDYTVALPDGRRISIGGDTFRDENGNAIEGKTPDGKAYNLDWDNPKTADTVALVDPLVLASIGPDAKNREQMVAKLANVAMLSDDPAAAVKKMYDDAGITRDDIYKRISDMPLEKGHDRDSYLATIDRIFGVQPTGEVGTRAANNEGGGSRPRPPSISLPTPPPVLPVPPPVFYGNPNQQQPPRSYAQVQQDIMGVQDANQSNNTDMLLNPNMRRNSRSLSRRLT